MLKKVRQKGGITEYLLASNGLRVLYAERKGSGVVTSNIVYRVGARDEDRGETGLAHMLEHMLFKLTKHDIARGTDSASMLFEREIGVTLNATTWKDRTSYYFSYPKVHVERALRIEAERMHDVVLTDKTFQPERTNVLSEYDMNAGHEEFGLMVQMIGVAMQSHPYGHETIGYREDIEDYTVEKLQRFYEKYYAPNNATLIVVGDVSFKEVERLVVKHFARLEPSTTLTARPIIREPKQEGLRSVVVTKPSTINLLALGVKHDGFPSQDWFVTAVAFELLAGGDDSVLHKALVDTGFASRVSASVDPLSDPNLDILVVSPAEGHTHDDIYAEIRAALSKLTNASVAPHLKKILARRITDECMARESSKGFVDELVEYVGAEAWEHFFETETLLRAITPAMVIKRVQTLFDERNLTLGKFIGTR